MKHWLENAVPAIPPNTIIALLDPDMIFVRPLTTQIRGDISLLTDRGIKDEEIVDFIGLGHPVSQTYGLGAPWTNDDTKAGARAVMRDIGQVPVDVKREIDEDVDTLGGLAFVIAGQVPNVGQMLLHEQSGWRLEILEADDKRVTRIRLFAPVPDAEEEGE